MSDATLPAQKFVTRWLEERGEAGDLDECVLRALGDCLSSNGLERETLLGALLTMVEPEEDDAAR